MIGALACRVNRTAELNRQDAKNAKRTEGKGSHHGDTEITEREGKEKGQAPCNVGDQPILAVVVPLSCSSPCLRVSVVKDPFLILSRFRVLIPVRKL